MRLCAVEQPGLDHGDGLAGHVVARVGHERQQEDEHAVAAEQETLGVGFSARAGGAEDLGAGHELDRLGRFATDQDGSALPRGGPRPTKKHFNFYVVHPQRRR